MRAASYWFVLVAALLMNDVRAAEPAPVTVLKASYLFDGKSGRITNNGVVVVQGTRILSVGDAVGAPSGAKIIDLGDATLLPTSGGVLSEADPVDVPQLTADELQAIQGAATLAGIAAEAGSLESGKMADIVAVKGNVLDDIASTEKPVFVMRAGKTYVGSTQ